jgi:hypothetical protein
MLARIDVCALGDAEDRRTLLLCQRCHSRLDSTWRLRFEELPLNPNPKE